MLPSLHQVSHFGQNTTLSFKSSINIRYLYMYKNCREQAQSLETTLLNLTGKNKYI